jgi:hypothetical protein
MAIRQQNTLSEKTKRTTVGARPSLTLEQVESDMRTLCETQVRLNAADLRALRRKLNLLAAMRKDLRAKNGNAPEDKAGDALALRGLERLKCDLAPLGATIVSYAGDYEGPWLFVKDRTYFPNIRSPKGMRANLANPCALFRTSSVAKDPIVATVRILAAGRYRVWGRGLWGEGDRSWRIEVSGQAFPPILAGGPETLMRWQWQRAGEIDLPQGDACVRIFDAGDGHEGVDCVVFTTDAAYDPQLEEELREEFCLELAPPSPAPEVNERGKLTRWLKRYVEALPEFEPPKSVGAWEKRRAERRDVLRGLLGLDKIKKPPLDARVVWEERRPDLLRQRIEIQSEEGWTTSFILIDPAPPGPYAVYETRKRTVICLPGQPGGARIVAGLDPAPERDGYGWGMARRTFMILCPDTRGFGPEPDLGLVGSFIQYNLRRPLLGMQAWDAIRCMDWLEQSGKADMDHVGVVGFGFGGGAAMYAAALDERFHTVVKAGYSFSWRHEARTANFARYRYELVAGLPKEMDMGEIDALIAPRPLLVSQSSKGGYVMRGAHEMAAQTRQVYDLYGLRDRFKVHFHDEPDVFQPEICLNFLWRWAG